MLVSNNYHNSHNNNKPRLRVGNLIRRVYYGLSYSKKQDFLKELDKLLVRYYTQAKMVPPKLSLAQRGQILREYIKTHNFNR